MPCARQGYHASMQRAREESQSHAQGGEQAQAEAEAEAEADGCEEPEPDFPEGSETVAMLSLRTAYALAPCPTQPCSRYVRHTL